MPNKTLLRQKTLLHNLVLQMLVRQNYCNKTTQQTNCLCVYILYRQRCWSGTEKKYAHTTHHTTPTRVIPHTIHTTHRSYYKTTTRLLHVVAIWHTKPHYACDKKCALTAHIMRDKRVPIIILYVASDKKTAVTPPYLTKSSMNLIVHHTKYILHPITI